MAYAQHGTISGKVEFSSPDTEALVKIGLAGTTRGGIADKDGSYSIRQVKPGKYKLEVSCIGFSPVIKNVEVTAGQETRVPVIRLEKSDERIDEVVVTGNHLTNYAEGDLSSSLRLTTPLLRTAQNIQVISKEVLQDQQLVDMLESVTRNTSGAMMIEHWGNFARINMRGFKLPAFRNGMNVDLPWGPMTEDLSIVERIEFVKGPAGFMLSAGEPGGFYNVVTKKPSLSMENEATATVGSFNLLRATLDAGGKLDQSGKLLYRLNVMASTKKSHRAYEFNDRYTIAPSVSYQISDRTKITGEYIMQYSKMNIIGSAYVFSVNGYESLPRNFSLSEPNIDPSVMKEHNLFINLQHKLDENWTLTAQLGYLHYTGEGSSLWADSVTVDGIYRSMSIWDVLSNARMGQVFVNGKAETGPVKHKILAGLDLSDKDYYADWFQTGALGGLLSYTNPVHNVPSYEIPIWDRSLSVRKRSNNYSYPAQQFVTSSSLYVQDELGMFDDRLLLTLAGRYTSYETSVYGATTDDEKITPRVGLNVAVAPNTSVYGLFDQAFTPQSGSDKEGNAFKPLEGNDLEGGIKHKWGNGRLQSTLTVYKVTKKNVLTSDPDNVNYSIQLGEVESKGVEFDTQGEILPGLNLILNYAYTDAETTEDTDPANVGQKLAGHAKHMSNGWFKYQFNNRALKGFGIALGYQYMADRASWAWGNANMDGLPDYFRLDGGLSWVGDKVNIDLNINNILDDYLYSGSGYQGAYYYWQSEPGINFRLNIGFKF
jgi:iron complex outermembrane receptor protein